MFRKEADRKVMADENRPCLFHVAGPCFHPKCLEAYSDQLMKEANEQRTNVVGREVSST